MANYEQLFLLEVLVDKVKLLTRALEAFAPECEDEPDTPIRVRVKFSDFPCFEITQDLAPPEKEKKDSDLSTTPIEFSSGKSCMFPMDPEQLIQDLIKYPMTVSVFKKNPEYPLPEIIGQTKVFLGDHMSNIIKKAAEWSLEEPLSEMIQNTFPLRNAQDQDVGTITMLIRLTCFGKTIITKFQIADNKKSFLFKNAKTQDYEFKCKKCMPGQPINRPRAPFSDEVEEEEPGWEGDGYDYEEFDGPLPYVDKEQMTESYEPPCLQEQPPTTKQMYSQSPGFQRHEFQGPGFTASMEVGFPDKCQSNYDQSTIPSGPVESHSTPMVKEEQKGKTKTRGKSLDSKKIEISNGVKLHTHKRKKRTKFHVPQGIVYPGIILGHKYCVNQGPPVPAKNGWAWKTTVPIGMKWEDMRGWRPGAYLKQAWVTLKAMEELRKMGKRKKVKRKPVLPDTRKTTVHIHRIKGVYHVTMNPIKGPEDKEEPEPVVYTLERSEDGSDASEIELDLTVPDPPYAPSPSLKHQAQQFCEEDLPLIQLKPVLFKKKRKKKKEKPILDSTKKRRRKRKSGSAKSKDSEKSDKSKKEVLPQGKAVGKGKEVSSKSVGKTASAGKGKKTPEKATSGKATTGKAASGKATTGKAASEKAASGKAASGKAASEKAASGKATSGKKAPSPGKTGTSDKRIPSSKKAPPEKKGPELDTKEKAKKKGKKKKKGDDDDDIYPWDDWIMKLKCKKKKTPED